MIKPIILSVDEINEYAERFLNQYHPSYSLPIPIEDIIDLQLKIDIIPIPALKQSLKNYKLNIDGFIATDFKSISVDEYIAESVSVRYRFTLAHEIAHRELHQYYYDQFKIKNVSDWKAVVSDEEAVWPVSVLEYQADMFAGLVLAPRKVLKGEFLKARENSKKLFKQHGVSDGMLQEFTVQFLAKTFNVSPASMSISLSRDHLSVR